MRVPYGSPIRVRENREYLMGTVYTPGDRRRVAPAIPPVSEPAEQDDPEVRYALAGAYGARWDQCGDPADRDRAIDHWQAVLAVADEPGGLVECGRLLGERAEADGDI